MISDERLQKSLKYLAETDEECAQAKALMKGMEHKLKTIRYVVYLEAQGNTIADREAQSYASETYRQAVKDYQDAVYQYETLATKRATETLIVEVWRSMNANRRQGNV